MSDYYQGSLLDAGQQPVIGELRPTRTNLTRGAWVDSCPGWITGSDELFLRLQNDVPWRAESREMYDRVVDVPRLLSFYGARDRLPDPLLEQMRDRLSAHYADELGEPFVTAGLCNYRDGNDSVAWHGDRIGRSREQDTMVAIVSIGAARRLSLRPRGGGEQIGFSLGHGDLVVMGGSCQRTWDHAILKTARPVGARISIQFRPRGVL
ncbi:alpha-ketoglutarate-dependent dioxygenase AlkB [Aeromicrobium wangtongii]|uniref:Alpha-ketoglutarate-dependent dioxygenase AlkB n=1 Tax=Aeromicrobium wangtongii TaxID=2969247 RepID=A0ABY5MAT7_9ACTN|nr:alpha-ketoglutarate-dependent dioxygenase AlkB [Aeromicrobium wangtongii]MCD9196683.1 alpha-ketoglutarate-dependent dioxygenase AlkB [Aeromicrobium wangtongii]UUP14193.1 alpha-ketoglutarate-dependent dioxygenase AlkB [Aeromicrobium wangtongii]